ncbi:hypothetical protein ACFE04_031137 [Oxalis oulophora]
MASSLQNYSSSSAASSIIHHTLFLNCIPQRGLLHKKGLSFIVKAEKTSIAVSSHCQESFGRRQIVAAAAVAPWFLLLNQTPASFAAENKKGFLPVTDNKDAYEFLYPFGWQEVSIAGQDKVFKDVIEPLESVSVNLVPTSKQSIREFGTPQEIAETLIKKVLAPPTQKTKLVEATEHDVDGKSYYTFEFTAQAPNYTRHALSTITVANGKFYTLTTGANERRWDKMKDKLHTVIDSFKVKA